MKQKAKDETEDFLNLFDSEYSDDKDQDSPIEKIIENE